MGNYLTRQQIEQAKDQLSVLYALPFAKDLLGTAWEQILATIKGGRWTGQRDNRARADIVVPENGVDANYSIKIEGLSPSGQRKRASDFLGFSEDFIVARPKIDDYFQNGQTLSTLAPDEIGAMVLKYYKDKIINKFNWDVIAFLRYLEVDEKTMDFIYWEEKPPVIYNPANYWWIDSGRATGDSRNVLGFPKTVDPNAAKLPRATFKWTSGGKQFYILYEFPHDADIWTVEKAHISHEEIQEVLNELLRKKREESEGDSTA